MKTAKWVVTKAVKGGFHVSAQANAYPDRPDIMDGVALFYNQDEAEFAAKAVNEHAALVAVAEAADLVGKANMRLLEAQRQGDKAAIDNATVDLYCELDRLADVRAGSEVAK